MKQKKTGQMKWKNRFWVMVFSLFLILWSVVFASGKEVKIGVYKSGGAGAITDTLSKFDAVKKSGLVACWQFEESKAEIAKDTSSYGNQGKICGQASRTKDIFGSCLSLDGIDDYVEVADSTSLNFGDSMDFTIELWLKTNRKNTWQMLIDKRHQRSPYEGYSFLIRNNNQLQFVTIDKTGVQASCQRDFSEYLDNAWHYIVGTADRDSKMSLYVDGVLFAAVDMSKVGNINTDLSFLIANGHDAKGKAKSNTVGPEFIDDICIYRRVLGAEEIAERYQKTLSLHPVLGKMEKDIERVVVYPPVRGTWASYGSLMKLNDGSILHMLTTGSRNNDKKRDIWSVRDEALVWTISRDGGKTWSKGFRRRDTPEDESNIIWQDPFGRNSDGGGGSGYQTEDGTIYSPFHIYNPDYSESDQKNNWIKLIMGESKDYCKSWKFREIPLRYTIAATFGGFLKLSDGTLLLNVYGAKEAGSFRLQAGLLRSTDDGKTWSDYTDMAPEFNINETDIVELPNGNLVSMSRSAPHNISLHQGLSIDKGRTWTVKKHESLKGCAPILHYSKAGPKTGTLILYYINKDRHRQRPRPELGLCFSHDGGKTWIGQTGSFQGYVSIIEPEPGKILCSMRGHVITFYVPFPVGIHAESDISNQSKPAIKVTWDGYNGDDLSGYEIHRATRNRFIPTRETLLEKVARDVSFHRDDKIVKGKIYYYRVIGMGKDGKIGHSWQASAKLEAK